MFRVTCTATATAQTINPTITIGSNTRSFAFLTTTIAGDTYVTAVFAAESRNGDVVTAQLNGGLTLDTNTLVNVKSFEIIEYCP